MARKKEKKKYIDRWLKEHPRISFYLNRDEYAKLMSVADYKNVSINVSILSLVDGFSKYYDSI